MSSHAYCIIAHSDVYCLQTLINQINDERNDIFLLIDKKTDPELFKSISCDKSTIFTPTHQQLINIQWGGISQVKAELLLFELALSHGQYDYIHLLSGSDLLLKKQDYIHNFFDRLPTGTNLIGIARGEFNRKDLQDKTMYYHFYTNKYRITNTFQRKLFSSYRKTAISLQKLLGLKRKWDLELFKGCNWVSITSEFANYLVKNKQYILKTFKGVLCVDEIYKQTMLMNSPFKTTVFNQSGEYDQAGRKIDWTRGNPYTWRESDFEELINSNALFARKFSSTTDKKIITKIYDSIREESAPIS